MKSVYGAVSITTGMPTQRGARLRSKDGLSWKQRNKDKVNERRRLLYKLDPIKGREKSIAYKKKFREKVNALTRRWQTARLLKLREEMFRAYGAKCACCGEDEEKFLQLDHKFNDGNKQRRLHGNNLYEWLYLQKLSWPKERHQLLCANCNVGKFKNKGICPHIKK